MDLVILAAHQHFRPMHFAYAVEQAKHVFMEKPMGVDVPGIRRISGGQRGDAKRKSLKVGVGLYMRHSRRVQETFRRVPRGGHWPRTAAVLLLQHARPAQHARAPGRHERDDLPTAQPVPFPVAQRRLRGRRPGPLLRHRVLGERGPPRRGQGGGNVLRDQSGDVFDHHCVEFTFADGAKLFVQTRLISGCWIASAAEARSGGRRSSRPRRNPGAAAWKFRGPMPNPYQVEHDVLVDAVPAIGRTTRSTTRPRAR